MKRKNIRGLLLLSSCLGIAAASPAFAQDQDGSESVRSAGDIIVTARRVEERLQDVPISITVFNQEQLTQQNVFSAKDLATYTPSLTAQSRYGNDYASFAIRGFTQEARTTASVGVYFADVVTPRSSPLAASGDGAGPGMMFDLQNVQVLKGPQGTLFGRNTTGGAVVLVPKRPTDKFEGYVEGSYGNHDMRRLQAVVNLPASDTIRLRAGVDWQKRDGWQKNVLGVGPKDFANIDYLAARLSLLVDVTPDIENYTVASYSKSTPNGSSPTLTDCTDPIYCLQLDRKAGLGDFAVSNWLPWAKQSLEVWQVSNTTSWVVNDNVTLKNIMSYGKARQDQLVDYFGVGFRTDQATLDALNPAFYPRAVAAGIANMYSGAETNNSPALFPAGNQGTFTEELQLQGNSLEGNLTWQVGAYFEKSTPIGWSGSDSGGFNFCPSLADFYNWACVDPRAIGLTVVGRPLQGVRQRALAKVHYRNVGLYAQATYNLTEQLSVDAGFRYTWDKSWGVVQKVAANYTDNTPANPATSWRTPIFGCMSAARTYTNVADSCNESGSSTSSAPTWMIGLNFKPIQDILIYAKYSRGYRQGAFAPQNIATQQNYEPEKVDVYEAGVKTSWRGAMPGSLNISGFYNDFRDMQLQAAFVDTNALPPALGPNPQLLNVGKARIYGLEAEATLSPFEGLNLQASYAYLNTKLQRVDLPVAQPVPGCPSGTYYDGFCGGYNLLSSAPVAGKRLPYTPEHKLTVSANYTLPLDESIGRVTIGGTFIYTGSIYYGEPSGSNPIIRSIFNPSDPQYNPSYSPGNYLANFNLGWADIMQSGLDAQFFITNAFDRRYYDARSMSRNRGFITRYLGEPRMYGARLRYNF